MLEIVNNNIRLTKGDSAYITLEIVGDIDIESLRVEVRDAPVPEGELLFEGSIVQIGDDIVWHIRPEDTAEAEYKTYVYDLFIETEIPGSAETDRFHITPLKKIAILPYSTEAEEGGASNG